MSKRKQLLLDILYLTWWFTVLLNMILAVIDLLGYDIPDETLMHGLLISIYGFCLYQMTKEK